MQAKLATLKYITSTNSTLAIQYSAWNIPTLMAFKPVN